MRLEVFCEDRLGLTRELLDLLVLRSIDLRGIEIDPVGRIYLNFAEIEFNTFSSLMAEIRRIAGVTDVRTIPWMPSEREHLALSALLEAMPEPFLSLDLKSKVERVNHASCQLFAQSQEKLSNHHAAQLIPGFNFQRWLDSNPQNTHSEHVVINGQNFLMEITPVYLKGEGNTRVLTGAVIMLRSTLRMGRQLQNLSSQDVGAFSQIIAVSPKMRHVVDQARKLASLTAPLLITGDTGTGKDLLAHAVHLASPRAAKPYLALNCASIPEDAVESELFGHAPEGKKGFFEQANGGSVLLDEIGEMSPRMQAKLLRFLNDGTFRRVGEDHEVHVDVRVICATQKNLVELVQKGIFREDLYYRLNVMNIHVPPLRERMDDIPLLIEHFCIKFNRQYAKSIVGVSTEVMDIFMRHGWPGNVRELEHVIERAFVLCEGPVILPDHIALETASLQTCGLPPAAGAGDEKERLLAVLEKNAWNISRSARCLGMSRWTLYRRMLRYGLVRPETGM